VIDKLNFIVNVEMICKRGQQRLYCLRKLSKFKVDRSLMILFYKSYIESVMLVWKSWCEDKACFDENSKY